MIDLKNQGVASISETALREFCEVHHIRKFAFFGSILTKHFQLESDIDVLVEFDKGHIPGFIGLAQMEQELAALFGGRKVDLRTPDDLSRYFRGQVVANAQVQYERQ